MAATSWILWVAICALAFGFTRWIYRRRETPGQGRGLLIVMRGLVIAILLLLVFDPDLPGGPRATGGNSVIVDASLSMGLAGRGGTTRWAAAMAAADRAGASRVTLMGDGASSVPAESLRSVIPTSAHTRLLPALRAVAEAGRHQVSVITDGGIEDADEVIRWLPRLGLDVRIEDVGAATSNRGLTRVTAPSWTEAGQPIEIGFELASTATAGSPVTVVVREQGRERGRVTVPTPAPGRVAPGSVKFQSIASESSEFVRYDISIEGGDEVADDDTRSVYVQVSAEPAGAVLVSFVPDWEPRFLQPVLERALGMPMRGFLRSGTQWVSVGSGLKTGAGASDAEVRRAVDHAELIIFHAYSSRVPDWAKQAAARAARLMLLPVGDGDMAAVGVPPTNAVAADWYLSDDIPASPVAPLLAGIDVRDVPPLTALRSPGRVPGAWVPATVSRGRRGAPYALALGGTTAGRRWVVALGEGYWRWAFWSPAARDVYERLWSALGGWLVDEQLASGPDAVAPASRLVARGEPARWLMSSAAPDSVRVRLRADSGGVVLDTVIAGPAGESVATAPVKPGHYAYELRAGDRAGPPIGFGEITVESYSDEFTRQPVSATVFDSAPTALVEGDRIRRPLHASIWPYGLLILLLSIEWVLRRRWGLR
jgi:hypothetical protein